MATFSGKRIQQEDFRCAICRQKNVFHCEHNTPYRDQFRDTYVPERLHMMSTTNQREIQRTQPNYNYNATYNDDRNMNSNFDPRYSQSRRSDYNSYPNRNRSSKSHKKKKTKKSCVIL
ncbi:unnamed protein product [Adineta steineri]|uniref:Uncharacterized protein n=1 Tax=Adineta steineri TaxID=433720 RepID=A0A814CMZ3_9BILA|nr:unnamed protein product [Adineta steineri]CAF1181129.1 unnamed protein product [Adineta steineri]